MSVAMVLFLRVDMSSLRFKEESGKKAKPPFCDKKPRTRESNRREESSDSSLASIMTAVNMCTQMHSELLAIVRSSEFVNSVSCYKCSGDHFVRSCPDLRLENGSYAKFCNYCQQAGHSVGRPSNPTCPTLICTVCPTCNGKGHTLDWCPQKICSSCNAQGHTSKVCRQRKPGRFPTFLRDSAPRAGYLFENPFPPCGDALSQSSTNGKIVNSSSASVLEKFGACIAESGRLVASLEEAYRPSGGTETTPHGENPRTKRAKLSQFVNDLEAKVSEMKLIFASSGCTDPFFPSPFGSLPPKKKRRRGRRRGQHGRERERWLAEPGTGNKPELRPVCVKPVLESKGPSHGPERTVAGSAFVGNLGDGGRDCEPRKTW